MIAEELESLLLLIPSIFFFLSRVTVEVLERDLWLQSEEELLTSSRCGRSPFHEVRLIRVLVRRSGVVGLGSLVVGHVSIMYQLMCL